MIQWTPGDVKAALIDAFQIDYLIGGRIGPKSFGSNMPSVFQDEIDYKILELLDAVDEDEGGTKGEHFNAMKRDRLAAISTRRKITPAEVSRMEAVLIGTKTTPSWLSGLLKGQDGQRNCLGAYSVQSAFWGLRGREFKEARFCKRIGWNPDTFANRRDTGAAMVTFRLNSIGVGCWTRDAAVPVQVKPAKIPLTYLLLEFLKDEPKTKYQFISYAHTQGILPERDIRSAAVIQAIGKLKAAGKISKLADGRLCRV
jgi:hypothetical protein